MPSSASNTLRLQDRLPHRLSVAANAVSRLIARAYENQFGLKNPQWRLLAVLANEGPLAPAYEAQPLAGIERADIARFEQRLRRFEQAATARSPE